jgi:hypothetical protein
MTRSGTSKSGKKWSTRMKNSYGYIKQTESEADGDHIDVFLNDDDPIYEKAFVIDQVDPETGDFDEHKTMLWFANADEAKGGVPRQLCEPGLAGLRRHHGAVAGGV